MLCVMNSVRKHPPRYVIFVATNADSRFLECAIMAYARFTIGMIVKMSEMCTSKCLCQIAI